jgi:DNA primase
MIDVEKVIASLDLTLTAQRGDEIQGLCPMHKKRTGREDFHPSWWINTSTGVHICFSCGYKGNLLSLVKDLKGVNSYDATDYLHEHSEITVDELLKKLRGLPQYVAPAPQIEMSEARLAIFDFPPEFALKERNLSARSAEVYGVLWDTENSNWILPLREPDFLKLIGWQEKGSRSRFFKNYPAGVKKSTTLFGVDVQRPELTIVVESPLDCLRLYTAGFRGAVATCGALISQDQAKLLRRSEKVIAAFDNPLLDSAGAKASEELRQYAKRYGIELSYFNYGDSGKKDPGDMTDEQIAWGIENAKDMIFGKKAYL